MTEPAITSNDRRALLAGIGGLAAGTFLGAQRAEAGPLEPPAAPAPTPGPNPRIAINQQNTPGTATALFRIAEPGSYYLPQDTNLPDDYITGILVESEGVTIDLMGFTLDGMYFRLDIGDPQPNSGVLTPKGVIRSDVVVRNGTIKRFGDAAVEINGLGVVENVRCIGNGLNPGNDSIRVGPGGQVRDCLIEASTTGIRASAGTVISNCHFHDCRIEGLLSELGACVIRDCAMTGCDSGIISDQAIVSGCSIKGTLASTFERDCATVRFTGVVHDCTFLEGRIGFTTRSGTASAIVLADCLARSNSSSGFFVDSPGVATRCVSTNNSTVGIRLGEASSGTHCEATSNAGLGIRGGSGSIISDSVAANNTGAGIQAQNGSIVSGNNVTQNNGGGINVVSGGRCLLKLNNIVNNRNANSQGFGIRAEGQGNWIEENNFILNAPGVQLTSSQNLVFSNSLRANNPHYDFGLGNHVGPDISTGNVNSNLNPRGNYMF